MISSIRSDYSIEAILGRTGPSFSGDNLPSTRRRRTRTVFSASAVKHMEREFEQNKYPDIRRREFLAAEISVSEARVQVWFQNRRARHNKRRLSNDTCPAENVSVSKSKRQRTELPLPTGNGPDSGMSRRLPLMATTLNQGSTAVCHSLQTPVFSTYPSVYYNGLILPSLWNLQSVCTSVPQETMHEADKADDIVKRLFRFSARDIRPAAEQKQEVAGQQQKQCYRMVVPTKKVTDCSVSELRVSESGRDVPEECVFTLEDEDSGLANDSFTDSL